MLKCECICSQCKKTIQAYQSPDGAIVPGTIIFDFINKDIVYLCPNCGFQNQMILEESRNNQPFPRIKRL